MLGFGDEINSVASNINPIKMARTVRNHWHDCCLVRENALTTVAATKKKALMFE